MKEKALYGVPSSGCEWLDMLCDLCHGIVGDGSRRDNDVWFRFAGELYGKFTTLTDDLILTEQCKKVTSHNKNSISVLQITKSLPEEAIGSYKFKTNKAEILCRYVML